MFIFFRSNNFSIRSSTLYIFIGLICFILNPFVELFENRRVDLLHEIRSGISISEQLLEFNYQAWVELQALIIIEESGEMPGAVFFLLAVLIYGEHLLQSRNARSPRVLQQTQRNQSHEVAHDSAAAADNGLS